jgi:hypothetical protein
MYLHVGQDFILNSRDVIGIFNLETTAPGRITHEFLRHAEKNGAVVPLSDAVPKSFILTDFPAQTLFLSPISTATLKNRASHFNADDF